MQPLGSKTPVPPPLAYAPVFLDVVRSVSVRGNIPTVISDQSVIYRGYKKIAFFTLHNILAPPIRALPLEFCNASEYETAAVVFHNDDVAYLQRLPGDKINFLAVFGLHILLQRMPVPISTRSAANNTVEIGR